MANTQAIKHEHVKAITNTGNIIAMLNKAGIENDKATEIAREIDIQLNAVLDEKLTHEDVTKILDEHLDDVATKEFVRAEIMATKEFVRAEIMATKEFVRAEIQTVRTEIQEVRTDMQTMETKIRTDMQTLEVKMEKGLRQNFIGIAGIVSVILGVFYFALTHNFHS